MTDSCIFYVPKYHFMQKAMHTDFVHSSCLIIMKCDCYTSLEIIFLKYQYMHVITVCFQLVQ